MSLEKTLFQSFNTADHQRALTYLKAARSVAVPTYSGLWTWNLVPTNYLSGLRPLGNRYIYHILLRN